MSQQLARLKALGSALGDEVDDQNQLLDREIFIISEETLPNGLFCPRDSTEGRPQRCHCSPPGRADEESTRLQAVHQHPLFFYREEIGCERSSSAIISFILSTNPICPVMWWRKYHYRVLSAYVKRPN